VEPGTETIRDWVRAGGSRSAFIVPMKSGNRLAGPIEGREASLSRER